MLSNILSFFSDLFVDKSASPAKKAGSAPRKPAKKKQGSRQAPGKGAPRRANAPTATKLLTKREDIPAFGEILSGVENVKFPLPKEFLARYAILLPKKGGKNVYILCQKPKKSVIDPNFLTIKNRCEKEGYKTTRYFATEEVISIVYESMEIKQSKQEALNRSSALQVDFTNLISSAVDEGVSDVHIEVRKESVQVKFRKDGSLGVVREWAVSYARKMAIVIYMVIAEKKETSFFEGIPQDASIEIDLDDGQTVRIRLSTLPTSPAGFDMVMRILKLESGNKGLSLKKLGYTEHQDKEIERGLSEPVGATIFAGITGSGKTTTLSTILSSIIEQSKGRLKVITVENPPENVIEGASQVPVMQSSDESGGANTFGKTIKGAMRCDPDILMIGEVRDSVSADLLVKATQTGHKVLSTVHATSAIDIAGRLRMLEVHPAILGSANFLSTLVFQSLIPKVCVHCSTGIDKFEAQGNKRSEELLERLMRSSGGRSIDQVRFKNDDGCSHCNYGINGRIVVAEVVIPTREMLACFQRMEDAKALDLFIEGGGETILSAGIKQMLAGICDPFDIEEKLGRLDKELIESSQISKSTDEGDFDEDYINGSD